MLTVAPRKLAAPLRVDGLELPAGVHVAPCIYLVHRREDLYPDARTLAAGALAGGRAAGVLRVDPVRRRRAPLPGRGLRDDGDGRGAAPRRRAPRRRARGRPRRAHAPARHHAAARPRRARRAQRCSLRLLRRDRLGRRQRLAVARLVDGDQREALGAVGQLGGHDLEARGGERRDARLARAVLRARDGLVAALALAAAAVGRAHRRLARS